MGRKIKGVEGDATKPLSGGGRSDSVLLELWKRGIFVQRGRKPQRLLRPMRSENRLGVKRKMNELERCALLGDRKAQEECTRQGILLPCPLCGNTNIRTSNWGMWRCWCPECRAKSDDCLRERDAIKQWNTRPAPPIGRARIVPTLVREPMAPFALSMGAIRMTMRGAMILKRRRGDSAFRYSD